MITYIYRWNVSKEQTNDFLNDWTSLTNHIKEYKDKYDLGSATLFSTDTGFIAIATWNSRAGWNEWRVDFAEHPAREKWRNARVSGPEEIKHCVQV